jgi:hypothetical protein
VTPKRIQRKRTKGWKMPANAVYVGRPTKWGNPFVVHGDHMLHGRAQTMAPSVALGCFRAAVHQGAWFSQPLPWPKGKIPDQLTTVEEVQRELRGKDLACWCPLDQPCHADVLLEIANAPL